MSIGTPAANMVYVRGTSSSKAATTPGRAALEDQEDRVVRRSPGQQGGLEGEGRADGRRHRRLPAGRGPSASPGEGPTGIHPVEVVQRQGDSMPAEGKGADSHEEAERRGG